MHHSQDGDKYKKKWSLYSFINANSKHLNEINIIITVGGWLMFVTSVWLIKKN